MTASASLMLIRPSSFSVAIGDKLECKYPQHGTRNILVSQKGHVESFGVNPKGKHWVRIIRVDGSYRTLSADKMIDVKIENLVVDSVISPPINGGL